MSLIRLAEIRLEGPLGPSFPLQGPWQGLMIASAMAPCLIGADKKKGPIMARSFQCDIGRIEAIARPSDSQDFYPYENAAEMVRMLGLPIEVWQARKANEARQPKKRATRAARIIAIDYE